MVGGGGKQFVDAFFFVSRQKFEVSGNHPVLGGIRRVRRISEVETWLQRWPLHLLIRKGKRMQGRNYHDHLFLIDDDLTA